jgi:hypothetical protein
MIHKSLNLETVFLIYNLWKNLWSYLYNKNILCINCIQMLTNYNKDYQALQNTCNKITKVLLKSKLINNLQKINLKLLTNKQIFLTIIISSHMISIF